MSGTDLSDSCINSDDGQTTASVMMVVVVVVAMRQMIMKIGLSGTKITMISI
jgi:hypothetical protein